MNIPAKEIKI